MFRRSKSSSNTPSESNIAAIFPKEYASVNETRFVLCYTVYMLLDAKKGKKIRNMNISNIRYNIGQNRIGIMKIYN